MSSDKPTKQPIPTSLTRRTFGKWAAAMTTGAGVFLTSCAAYLPSKKKDKTPALECIEGDAEQKEYEYIVVGSGAGGGPLAANLAKAGHRVLLIEAGGDPESINYQVPVFHPLASEDDSMKWDFFVRHYNNDVQQRKDNKYVEAQDGVLYPRSGTLGGCTGHNAMITIYPHNSDWDYVADVTGDDSWRADNMRKYFERLERCQYVKPPRDPDNPKHNKSRHGFSGWLTTNTADPKLLVRDKDLKRLVASALIETFKELRGFVTRVLPALFHHLDPNDWRQVKRSAEGIVLTPLATKNGRRTGTREYILDVQDNCDDNLTVKLDTLVTRVLFEGTTAVGVEVLEGANLYRASANPSEEVGVRGEIRATREVILAGGAFNTPQLLKLSGIGPQEELQTHGIETLVDLPGVGKNLQDRYEVGIVSEMKEDFNILAGATFKAPAPGEDPDPQFKQWLQGKGVYTTNGAIIALVKRSEPQRPEPDLFIFGLAGYFRGYFPGYSQAISRNKNFFTWAVLKAHTNNSAGDVTLRSNDPRDVPQIDFRYFDEGNDNGEDLESVVAGVEFVRRMTARNESIIKQEVVPGPEIRDQSDIRTFVQNNAWGHHASCTCKIGSDDDPMAVLDSRFRVRGVQNLRVVDASVFPKIPGFFIVTSIYMVSEKASDVILEDAQA